MLTTFKKPITAKELKAKARELGADLVGIADGRVMDEYPPPDNPVRPIDLTELDSDKVIVLAKRVITGTSKITTWNDRHKFYNDEIALTKLEQASLDLVFWLEDNGYPGVIIPPTHIDPWRYQDDPGEHLDTLISLTHAAVEAGLGTLGLNLQLLTPEFGPRVLLTAVLCSVDVEVDARIEDALCQGPECGRCLRTCPGDTVKHWDRDWSACDKYRYPYGFQKMTDHLSSIIDENDPAQQKELLRSEDTFYLWQSILRGAGAINGCRSCQDVCPVGEDYEKYLKDVRDVISEDTPEKQHALSDMIESEQRNEFPLSFINNARWIGKTGD